MVPACGTERFSAFEPCVQASPARQLSGLSNSHARQNDDLSKRPSGQAAAPAGPSASERTASGSSAGGLRRAPAIAPAAKLSLSDNSHGTSGLTLNDLSALLVSASRRSQVRLAGGGGGGGSGSSGDAVAGSRSAMRGVVSISSPHTQDVSDLAKKASSGQTTDKATDTSQLSQTKSPKDDYLDPRKQVRVGGSPASQARMHAWCYAGHGSLDPAH